MAGRRGNWLRRGAVGVFAALLGATPAAAARFDATPPATVSPVVGSAPPAAIRLGLPAAPDPLRNGPAAALRAPAARPRPALLVRVSHSLPVTSRPGGGRVIGTLVSHARYSGQAITAWVMRTTRDGRFGLVPVAYSVPYRAGWIRLAGLRRASMPISVLVDLSRHRLTVSRFGRVIMRVPVATGSPFTPTPPGRYFVTERVPFAPSSAYGAFVFGISGIQSRLPCCGNLLAIHGTNNPGSIGRSVSAGCIRVGAAGLQRLRRLLWWGTPVVFQP